MPIIRIAKRQRHYSVIANDILEDQRLSLKAKGLLVYLLSRPDDWTIHVHQLGKLSPHDGRDSIRSGLNDLVKTGYVIFDQPRENGQFTEGGWTVYEHSIADYPATANPLTGNPATANPSTAYSILLPSTEDLEEELSSTILSGTGASAIPQGVNGHQEVTAFPAKRKKKPKEVKPLADDDWLRDLLYTYAEHFDVAALDDDDWWANTGNSFPDFTSSWVHLAFASLARWLGDNPKRKPRTPRGWRQRMTFSLNWYYDKHARRTS